MAVTVKSHTYHYTFQVDRPYDSKRRKSFRIVSEGQRKSHKKVEAERKATSLPKVINPIDHSVLDRESVEQKQPFTTSHQARAVDGVPDRQMVDVVPAPEKKKTIADIEAEHKARIEKNKPSDVEVKDKQNKNLDKIKRWYGGRDPNDIVKDLPEKYLEDSSTESESSLSSDTSDY